MTDSTQSYGTAAPRIGTSAPGLIGKALGTPAPKPNPNVIQVKAHTRVKPGKK